MWLKDEVPKLESTMHVHSMYALDVGSFSHWLTLEMQLSPLAVVIAAIALIPKFFQLVHSHLKLHCFAS